MTARSRRRENVEREGGGIASGRRAVRKAMLATYAVMLLLRGWDGDRAVAELTERYR